MFRKLSFASNVNNKDKVKSLKQTNLTSKSLSSAPDDDLDDVAVISNTNPDQVTYGSSYGPRGLSFHFILLLFCLLFCLFLLLFCC